MRKHTAGAGTRSYLHVHNFIKLHVFRAIDKELSSNFQKVDNSWSLLSFLAGGQKRNSFDLSENRNHVPIILTFLRK